MLKAIEVGANAVDIARHDVVKVRFTRSFGFARTERGDLCRPLETVLPERVSMAAAWALVNEEAPSAVGKSRSGKKQRTFLQLCL